MSYIHETREENINNILEAQRMDEHHTKLMNETVRPRAELDGTQIAAKCHWGGSALMYPGHEYAFAVSVIVVDEDEHYIGNVTIPRSDMPSHITSKLERAGKEYEIEVDRKMVHVATLSEIVDEEADEFVVAIDMTVCPGKWYKGHCWIPKPVIEEKFLSEWLASRGETIVASIETV